MNLRYRIAKLLLGWANKVDPKRRTHCSPTENYIFYRRWNDTPYGVAKGVLLPKGETVYVSGVTCKLLHDTRVLSATIEACGGIEEFKRFWFLRYSTNKSNV